MPKTPLPLQTADMSAFCRPLGRQLGSGSPPHLTLMNMVARAAGHQNLQHMRAVHAAKRRLETAAEDQPWDARAVERCLNQFNSTGQLRQWPAKRSVQTLALWALWATLPAGRPMPEREVGERLRDEHLFEDPATLRRTMIACGLLTRRAGGTGYRRIEQKPPREARALIEALAPRRQKRPLPAA